jgi:hypothetical protein
MYIISITTSKYTEMILQTLGKEVQLLICNPGWLYNPYGHNLQIFQMS